MEIGVEACSTLAGLGSKLQLISTRTPRDHRPLFIQVQVETLKPLQQVTLPGEVACDQDKLMMGLRRVQGRKEFVQFVEERMNNKNQFDFASNQIELP